MIDEEIVGLPEAEAVQLLKEAGLIARIAIREGEPSLGKDDHILSRVNLVIMGGKVAGASRG